MPEKSRAFGYDNVKFILIFLVVFAHMLEMWGRLTGLLDLYRIIYSFHMPVFIFLNGFFARHSWKKFVCRMVYPYFLFQILYLLFGHFVLDGGSAADFQLQFTTPYWILWYQLVLIFCFLLLPLFRRLSARQCIAAVAVCFAISLLAGFSDRVGYYLSLSRFFTFLPYFVLGHLAGRYREQLKKFMEGRSAKWKGLCAALTCGVLAAALYIWKNTRITGAVLYGSYSYHIGGYHVGTKLILCVIALVWIAFFLFVVQVIFSRRIPVLSTLGKNTFPIFMLHAAVLKAAQRSGLFGEMFWYVQPLLFAAAFLVLLLLGNPAVAKVFRIVFAGGWLERLWERGKTGLSR